MPPDRLSMRGRVDRARPVRADRPGPTADPDFSGLGGDRRREGRHERRRAPVDDGLSELRGLAVVTFFAKPSDKHLFWVKQPGFRKPTFKIFWRTDRGDDRYIRVTTARRTRIGPAGSGVCTVRRENANAGPAARRMEFTLPPYCLRLRKSQDIPRLRLNQQSFDVSDGVNTQTDALDYTRYLTRRRPAS